MFKFIPDKHPGGKLIDPTPQQKFEKPDNCILNAFKNWIKLILKLLSWFGISYLTTFIRTRYKFKIFTHINYFLTRASYTERKKDVALHALKFA